MEETAKEVIERIEKNKILSEKRGKNLLLALSVISIVLCVLNGVFHFSLLEFLFNIAVSVSMIFFAKKVPFVYGVLCGVVALLGMLGWFELLFDNKLTSDILIVAAPVSLNEIFNIVVCFMFFINKDIKNYSESLK